MTFIEFILVLQGVGVLGTIFCMLMLLRNFKLYEYRMSVLNSMHQASRDDITAGYDWEWRHQVFDQVSYDEMFWKFWRRFDSFWPDKRFMYRGRNESKD